MNQNSNPSAEFIVRHFGESDRGQFLAMVDDEEIKANFDEFKLEKEIIGYKFSGLNDEIPLSQYWGIFLTDSTLVGFIALKKSHAIFKTLDRLKQETIADVDVDITFETNEQRLRREWREKIKAPYAVDVAVHKDYRRKDIARKALNKIYAYAASAGLKEIYFEVREDNRASKALIAGFDPKKTVSAADHYGHEIFRLDVNTAVPSKEELLEEIRKAPAGDKSLLITWKHTVTAFPDLAPHRKLILSLFRQILAHGADLVTTDQCKGCRHVVEYDKKKIIVCLAKRENPLTLVWSLAHELGHLKQEEAKGLECKDFTLEKFMREEDAWKIAEKLLSDEPLFIYNWDSFFQFRHERLESYLHSNA